MIDRVYFPNLCGLRFIAAFAIIIHHLEQTKSSLNYNNYWNLAFIKNLDLGVTFFFVLSGFLITYLLLSEKLKTKNISIKNFYIRRILRIWPLYYLIIILAYFVLNKIYFFKLPETAILNSPSVFFKTLTLYIFFLPNVVLFSYAPMPYASQTWSIGVEEQFYFIWPILMKYIKNKYFILIGIIAIYILSVNLILPLLIEIDPHSEYLNKINYIIVNFKIDCMAVGGLFAYLLFKKNKIINILNINILCWINIILLLILMALDYKFPYLNNEVYAIIFSIIILNFSTNSKPIFNLENKLFNYFGNISYGIYMYHTIAIVISVKMLASINIYNYWCQLMASTLISIILASLSYNLLEKKFLKLKKKFTKIRSL